MASFAIFEIGIYHFRLFEIVALMSTNISITVINNYTKFGNIFLSNLLAKFIKQTKINNDILKLIKNQ